MPPPSTTTVRPIGKPRGERRSDRLTGGHSALQKPPRRSHVPPLPLTALGAATAEPADEKGPVRSRPGPRTHPREVEATGERGLRALGRRSPGRRIRAPPTLSAGAGLGVPWGPPRPAGRRPPLRQAFGPSDWASAPPRGPRDPPPPDWWAPGGPGSRQPMKAQSWRRLLPPRGGREARLTASAPARGERRVGLCPPPGLRRRGLEPGPRAPPPASQARGG